MKIRTARKNGEISCTHKDGVNVSEFVASLRPEYFLTTPIFWGHVFVSQVWGSVSFTNWAVVVVVVGIPQIEALKVFLQKKNGGETGGVASLPGWRMAQSPVARLEPSEFGSDPGAPWGNPPGTLGQKK